MDINITEEQIDELWSKFDDDEYTIQNKDLNLPERDSMTEREQMLFVINHLEQKCSLLEDMADDNMYFWFDSRPVDKEFIEEKYLLNGEFMNWEFE